MALGKRLRERLLAHADVVLIIQRYLGEDNLTQTTEKHDWEFIASCPFHDESTPSFTVTRRKQFFHCFGCGAHGNAIEWVMQYEGLDFVRASMKVAELSGFHIPSGRTKVSRARRRSRGGVRWKKKLKARRKHEHIRHEAFMRRLKGC